MELRVLGLDFDAATVAAGSQIAFARGNFYGAVVADLDGTLTGE